MAFIPKNDHESPYKRPVQIAALISLFALPFCQNPKEEKPSPVASTVQKVEKQTRRIVTQTHSEPEVLEEPEDTAASEREVSLQPMLEIGVPYAALSELSACITDDREDVACRINAGIIDSSLMCYSVADPERPPLHIRHTTLDGEIPNEDRIVGMAMDELYPLWNEVDNRRFIMAPGIWGWSNLENINEAAITDMTIPLDDMESGLEDLCDRASTWFDSDPGNWCTGPECERMGRMDADWIGDLNKNMDQLGTFEDTLKEEGWALSEFDDSFTLGFDINEYSSIQITPSESTGGVNVSIKTPNESGYAVELLEAETPEDLLRIIENSK